MFVDERFKGMCVYCGSVPSTRDHVPSRVLLDEPYPAELPVVEACAECNNGFSSDEAYVACFLECVHAGSTDPEKIKRPRISRMLANEPALRARIAECVAQTEDGTLIWKPEDNRFRNVILKLARGHADYELSLQQFEEPEACWFTPLMLMTVENRAEFENPEVPARPFFPEIGSRAFIRGFKQGFDVNVGLWIVPQPGRYRYMVDQTSGLRVQIVIGEYLACQVRWE